MKQALTAVLQAVTNALSSFASPAAAVDVRLPRPHERIPNDRERFFTALGSPSRPSAAAAAAAAGIPARTAQRWCHDALANAIAERDRNVANPPHCAVANGKGEDNPRRIFSDAQETALAAYAVRNNFSPFELRDTAELLWTLNNPTLPNATNDSAPPARPHFSDRWMEDFKERTGMTFRNGRERSAIADVHTAAIKLWQDSREAAKSLAPQRPAAFINIDEVRVNTESAPHKVATYLVTRTDLTASFPCPPSTHARTAVTFLVAETLDGRLFVGAVLPGERQWRNGGSVFGGVWLLYNANGYVDSGAYLAFLEYVLSRVEGPVVIYSDAARYHSVEVIQQLLNARNARAVGVPPCTTGALQPLDVSVFAVLKRAFAHYYALLKDIDSFGPLRTTSNLHRLIITAMDLAAAHVRAQPHVLAAGWRHSGLLRVLRPIGEPDILIPLPAFMGGSVSTSDLPPDGTSTTRPRELLEKANKNLKSTPHPIILAPMFADDDVVQHTTSDALRARIETAQIGRHHGKPNALTPAQTLQLDRARALADSADASSFEANNGALKWPGATGKTPHCNRTHDRSIALIPCVPLCGCGATVRGVGGSRSLSGGWFSSRSRTSL